MTEGAVIVMQAEDTDPGIAKLGVTEVAVISLGLVYSGLHGYHMRVVMAGKVGGVTAGAFAGSANGRADTGTIYSAVAGGAAVLSMDFT